jgi:hypothetical protein
VDGARRWVDDCLQLHNLAAYAYISLAVTPLRGSCVDGVEWFGCTLPAPSRIAVHTKAGISLFPSLRAALH